MINIFSKKGVDYNSYASIVEICRAIKERQLEHEVRTEKLDTINNSVRSFRYASISSIFLGVLPYFFDSVQGDTKLIVCIISAVSSFIFLTDKKQFIAMKFVLTQPLEYLRKIRVNREEKEIVRTMREKETQKILKDLENISVSSAIDSLFLYMNIKTLINNDSETLTQIKKLLLKEDAKNEARAIKLNNGKALKVAGYFILFETIENLLKHRIDFIDDEIENWSAVKYYIVEYFKKNEINTTYNLQNSIRGREIIKEIYSSKSLLTMDEYNFLEPFIMERKIGTQTEIKKPLLLPVVNTAKSSIPTPKPYSMKEFFEDCMQYVQQNEKYISSSSFIDSLPEQLSLLKEGYYNDMSAENRVALDNLINRDLPVLVMNWAHIKIIKGNNREKETIIECLIDMKKFIDTIQFEVQEQITRNNKIIKKLYLSA